MNPRSRRLPATKAPIGVALEIDNNSHHAVVIVIRTQVSFSVLEYEAAKQEAKRLGISLAEWLRRSLRTMLPADASKPWMRYAGLIETGDPEASRKIDDVIHQGWRTADSLSSRQPESARKARETSG